MNILRKGRLYDDTPTPEVGTEYDIARVSLKVARNGSKGRWEAHSNSRALLHRLDNIGRNGLSIVDITIGGEKAPQLVRSALDIYIRSCPGLKYFRRGKVVSSTSADVASLLSRIGFPKEYVTQLKKPTNQVSDRSGNTLRA